MRIVLVGGALVALASAARGAGPDAVLFPIVRDGKWGYIDRTGRVIVGPRFDRAERFSEGLGAVQLGARHGYVDATGEMVLVPEQPPAGSLHRPFGSGLAVVRLARGFGYIDRRGKLALPGPYDAAHDFTDGYAMVCLAQGCGYVDPSGRGVIPAQFMASDPVSDGLACVNVAMGMGRRRTWLVSVGGAVVARDLEGCGRMSEGLVPVRVAQSWGYLDAQGRPALQPTWEWAGHFGSGRAPVRTEAGTCGYIGRDGRLAIPARYRSCEPFSDGLALVDLAAGRQEGERVAFVAPDGSPVAIGAELDPPFDSAERFRDGLAAVGSGGPPHLAGAGGPSLGYIDTSGRYVWKPTN